jgi:UPF0042 nucleotide-binding protein
MSEMPLDARVKLVIVTGLSGAGRTTTIRCLEDLGYETIDNLPISLVSRVVAPGMLGAKIAIGLDTRTRDFTTKAVLDMLAELSAHSWLSLEVVFVTASNAILVRRFSETRRRHPLAPAETPHDGIDRERDLLNEIQDASTVVLNTSDMSPHDLRAQVDRFFNRGGESKLAIMIHSFSYKRGVPAGIDMVFDCRFLNNPYWDPSLRSLNGRSDGVQRFVQNDTRFEEFFAKVMDLSVFLLPAYVDEGKTHFSIGFGCTGGQHRSVAFAETVAKALANHGWVVSVRHRELERRAKR